MTGAWTRIGDRASRAAAGRGAGGPPAGPARVAAVAVVSFSVAYAVFEVALIGLRGSATDLAFAACFTALFLPLHVWHLRFGLVARRPPAAGATLALATAVHVAALLVIGTAWALMLTLLATSALVVLRPVWALPALAACAAAPAALDGIRHVFTGGNALYLGYTIVMLSVVEFALVWLVAATTQLEVSESARADEAAASERARLHQRARTALEVRLRLVARHARAARQAVDGPAVSAPLLELDRMLEQSRGALAELRELVADERTAPTRPVAAGLARVVRAARSPVGAALEVRRAVAIGIVTHAVVLPFVLLSGLGALGPVPTPNPALLVVAWSTVAVLMVGLSVGAARGRPAGWAAAAWLAMAAVAVAARPFLGLSWGLIPWTVAAGAALALRGRVRVAAVALTVVAGVLDQTITGARFDDRTEVVPVLVTFCAYSALAGFVSAGLYASTRLVHLTDRLARARDELAVLAAHATRRRLSRDLHDVLGQSLTAISLKGDLARHLLTAGDRGRATGEIDELVALAGAQEAELDAVARGEREVALGSEADLAVGLLRSAGVEVDARLELDGVDPDAGVLLAWALREGSTNVLRHANARTCTIRVRRTGGRVLLELENDGALARGGRGSGLAGLADRVTAIDGSAEGVALPGHRFRLRVELPA